MPAGTEIYTNVYVAVSILNTATGITKTISDYVNSVQIRMRRNEPMQWSLTLDNSTRAFTRGAGGAYDGWLDCLAKYRWSITLYSLSDSKAWTYLVNVGATYSSGEGGYEVTIQGTDASWNLLDENQSMDSWRSTTGNVKMARATIITAILAEFGMSGSLSFTDYPVRFLHFQGEIPLDVISKLLRPVWAEWYVSGNTFYARDQQFASAGPADWTLNDDATIENLSYSYQRSNIVTKVEVRRADEGAAAPFQEEGMAVGYHYESTSYPCVPSGLITETQYGDIIEVYLFDAAGNFAAYPNAPAGAVTAISFVFQQKGGLTAAEAANLYYKISLKGRPFSSDSEWGGEDNDPTYAVTKTNTTLEGILGESIPAKDPPQDELLATLSMMNIYGEKFLAESARQLERVSGAIGFQPDMVWGDTVYIREHGTGLAGYWYLEDVTHTVSSDSMPKTTITATKFRSDTIS